MHRDGTIHLRGPGIACCLLAAVLAAPAAGQVEGVIRKLNNDDTVKGTEQSKSYRLLFDAYLEMEPPPFEISARFNLTTIHPKMDDWSAVSGWAESNPGMAEAILRCLDRNILGLPYGREEVESTYREADLVADVGGGGSLRRTAFPYLDAVDTIAAYAVAETYRRLEAGDGEGAVRLAVGHNWVLRQMCDRQFLEEKLRSIQLLIDALSVLRDALYAYLDTLTPELCTDLAKYDLPGLRPDRNRLHIPEGDRVVSEALLREVFNQSSNQPDPEKFADTFAAIQSADAPLTRFGAARRWRRIALVHDSLEASQNRLELIYDDWWRRWRVQEYDAILDTDTQFQRTNPVRYAAVIYSIADLREVFTVRNQLVAAVNGTAVAAGLCAYKLTYGVYPDDKEKTYGQFVRKRLSDVDPYDEEYGRLLYRQLSQPETVDTLLGRLELEKGMGILWSRGEDHQDDYARTHSDDAVAGDLVLWPPIRQLSRDQGLID